MKAGLSLELGVLEWGEGFWKGRNEIGADNFVISYSSFNGLISNVAHHWRNLKTSIQLGSDSMPNQGVCRVLTRDRRTWLNLVVTKNSETSLSFAA